jgi:tetratricopeptide (TPR) repeat protein
MDVFLSYNSVDHSLVEDIARRLRDQGLEPFLDRWYLVPGMRWRVRLEETLCSCKAVAIFVGPGEMGSWQQRELDVALDLESRNSDFRVIPVLLPGCEPPLGFLRQLTWVDLRNQSLDRGVAILAKAARGEAPGPDIQRHLDVVRASVCPYRGLLHFREEDAPFFFGREAAIGQLTNAVERQSFVAVVGASGSGKSSVVRAGLVPRLRSDRNAAWEIVTLVPTDQPLKSIAMALMPFLDPTMDEVDRLAAAGKLADHLNSGTISLSDIVGRILDKQPGTDRVLIFVDQFEELYTLTVDDAARRRFLDELLAASASPVSRVTVAITLRGDFVGKALAYRPLSDRLQDAQTNLGPMTREELALAINKPAEKTQLEFEPGLVERILDAVGDEPGNLPLLEFVLKELWEDRRGELLLNQSYDAIGELQGAVAKKADKFLNGLSLSDQKILQRVFLRIVRPSESGENTRRRAVFAELPAEGIDLVAKLANERLLVTNKCAISLQQTVEVAHEALISNWSTLRSWINEDREFLLWRERLGTLLVGWELVQKDEAALLRGQLLIEAQKWFDQRNADLSNQERAFVATSRALRERLEREELEEQQKELAQARALAQERWHTASKLRRLALVAAGAAVAALIFFVVSAVETGREKSARDSAEHSALTANAARDQADSLINFMLFDLREKLQPLGRLSILDAVVEKAKQYLDHLPKDAVTVSRLRQQSVTLNNLGDVLSAQGRLWEALNAYQQGLAIVKRLADQDTSNALLQHDLSVSYERVSDVLSAQGQLEGALEANQQSLAIRKNLADRDKFNVVWQRDLSVSYNRAGDVSSAQGKLQEALGAYKEAGAIAKKLADQDGSNAGLQRDLSVSYERIGNLLSTQGKSQEALDAYEQLLAIAKKLVDHDKSNSILQRDLSVSYNKVGDVLMAQGKLQEAVDAYQQGLMIARMLARQDESNIGWRRDLIVSYYKTGKCMVKFGGRDNSEQGKRFLRTGLDLAESLLGADRESLINAFSEAINSHDA